MVVTNITFGWAVEMKKICYVVTIPITIRSFFIPQLEYLAENGFDVSVICSNDGVIKNELGEMINYIPLDIPRGISFCGSIRAIKQLTNIFRREQFDIIQYSTPNAALYASIAAKRVGCPIRNYHMMGLRYLGASGFGRKFLKLIEKNCCNNSTSIECVSYSNLEMGISEGLFTREKVCVVWNGSTGGVDLKRFDYVNRKKWRNEIRSQLGFEGKDFIYGFVGRVTKDKGINELLEAFAGIKEQSKLLLLGPMDEIDTLDQGLLDSAKLNQNILFHDVVTDVEKYYAAIDVLVLPSYREGFGNVVIEAAALGTPAIVSRIPGPVDTVIAGETALLVSPQNVDELRGAMLRIMHEDYRQMGIDAHCFVKNSFDSKVLCEKIFERKRELIVEK